MSDTCNNLRGLVVARFGSISKFAKHLGWSYAKTYRLVHMAQQPESSDICAMADALQMDNGDVIVSTFILPYRSQNANKAYHNAG